jgi:RHS repeat-associated protein
MDRYYANGLQLAKNITGAGLFYLVSDAEGSIRDTVSAGGSTTFSSDYLPYGRNYNIQLGLEELMYTDKPYDTSTGLYYYVSRFYNLAISRFMSEDTYPGSLNNPISLNRYVYAQDNPLTFVDPSGHMIARPYGGGEGGGGNSYAYHQTPQYANNFLGWLRYVWLPNPFHIMELAWDFVAVAAAVIGTSGSKLFGLMDRFITAAIFGQFVTAVLSGSLTQIIWSAVPVIAWALAQVFIRTSIWTIIQTLGWPILGNLVLATASGGTGYILFRLGYAAWVISSIAISLYGETMSEFNQYKNSG